MNLQELSAFADQAESVRKLQVKNEKEKEEDDKFDKLTAMLEKMSVNAMDAQKEQRGRGGKSDKEDCPRCGEYHFRNNCRFRYATCFNCKRVGHIRSALKDDLQQVIYIYIYMN